MTEGRRVLAAASVSVLGLVAACSRAEPRDAPQAAGPLSSSATSAGPPPPSGSTDMVHLERVDRTHALPADYAPADLVTVGPGFEKNRAYQLRRDAAEAWARMHQAALADGIALRIVSAYRSYENQQRVYENKVKRDGPDQDAVAAPGHSEHQLGTAIDVAGPDKESVLQHAFGEMPAGRWLAEHAPEFGFAISYTQANHSETGYTPEPWHYRYYGAAARAKHDAAMTGR